jgi:hypothetical protein
MHVMKDVSARSHTTLRIFAILWIVGLAALPREAPRAQTDAPPAHDAEIARR